MNIGGTHIAVILDRTGSMGRIRDDTIGGFNSFLTDQKNQTGHATLTLAQFDTQDPYEVLCRSTPVSQVPYLTRETYIPRAATPLLDAIGHGIRDTEASLASMTESRRPSKVVVVIITDGRENSSREYRKNDIGTLVGEKQSQLGWQCVFLGADMAGIEEARAWGVSHMSSMGFCCSSHGARRAWKAASARISDYRGGRRAAVVFTEEDRQEQAGDDKDP